MSDDKMIAAWNKMNPDSVTKEKILREIMDKIETTETVKKNKKNNFIKKFRRFAVGFAAAAALLLGSFGTAYAASPAFREYFHSLLFPLYTSNEMISIDNGHMTGSFDKTDVLLSFLDRFNKKEFGNSLTAKRENGYHYSLYAQNENQFLAFVESSMEGYCIVVYMERMQYESTKGIWQVTGYQILEESAAENIKNQLEPYFDNPEEETVALPQEDTVIKGTEDSVVIYNVNDKKNVVSVDEEDGKVLSEILSTCDRSEDITGGLFEYVIKIDDTSYMFGSDGNGMVNTGGKRWGITIEEDKMGIITALFEQYQVLLEEKEQNFEN